MILHSNSVKICSVVCQVFRFGASRLLKSLSSVYSLGCGQTNSTFPFNTLLSIIKLGALFNKMILNRSKGYCMTMNGVTNIKVVFKYSMCKGLGTVYPEIQICLYQISGLAPTSVFFNKTILKKYNYDQNEIEHLYC